jgi:hypothetical protein
MSLSFADYSDLTGTKIQVVEVFFSTHGEGFSFELSRDQLSITAISDGVSVGRCMLPVPPSSRMFQQWETRRENWWFLLGFVIGLKQISGRMRMQSDAGAEALARLPWFIPATAQNSMYPNGECPLCGSRLIGDGFRDVLRCENADPESYARHEPDANPVFCESNNPEESLLSARSSRSQNNGGSHD